MDREVISSRLVKNQSVEFIVAATDFSGNSIMCSLPGQWTAHSTQASCIAPRSDRTTSSLLTMLINPGA